MVIMKKKPEQLDLTDIWHVYLGLNGYDYNMVVVAKTKKEAMEKALESCGFDSEVKKAGAGGYDEFVEMTGLDKKLIKELHAKDSKGVYIYDEGT